MQQQFPVACTGALAERVQGVREEIERRLAEATAATTKEATQVQRLKTERPAGSA